MCQRVPGVLVQQALERHEAPGTGASIVACQKYRPHAARGERVAKPIRTYLLVHRPWHAAAASFLRRRTHRSRHGSRMSQAACQR
jgi:hypothetical protein